MHSDMQAGPGWVLSGGTRPSPAAFFTRIKRRQLLAIIFLSDSNALLLLLLFQVITLRGNVDFIFHVTLCISHSLSLCLVLL